VKRIEEENESKKQHWEIARKQIIADAKIQYENQLQQQELNFKEYLEFNKKSGKTKAELRADFNKNISLEPKLDIPTGPELLDKPRRPSFESLRRYLEPPDYGFPQPPEVIVQR
jgi:hypothetical protein